ncbi:MAG TPA: hypothetical protein VE988_01725 [Gemmataceae bacterium]|nr:hypothetical protein [Gemmataceae bacterium]
MPEGEAGSLGGFSRACRGYALPQDTETLSIVPPLTKLWPLPGCPPVRLATKQRWANVFAAEASMNIAGLHCNVHSRISDGRQTHALVGGSGVFGGTVGAIFGFSGAVLWRMELLVDAGPRLPLRRIFALPLVESGVLRASILHMPV